MLTVTSLGSLRWHQSQEGSEQLMLDSERALALAVYEEKRDKLHFLLSTFKGFKVTVRSILR